jgi:ketosteroid isomerase-like protein
MNGIRSALTASLLTSLAAVSTAAVSGPFGPTAKSAWAADEAVAGALRANDAQALGQLLAADWVVISAHGAVADRDGFLAAIRSGAFTRKTLELSEPRVRVYGNTALVTAQVKTSGVFGGRNFDVTERETDVLIWRNGGWKAVLSHETEIIHG